MMESLTGWFTEGSITPVDSVVLLVYLLVMVGVGYICRKASANVSDYIRMGSKGTWWLIGLSIFMQAVSAITFTANCAVAYLAGFSALWTAAGGILGLLIHGFFLAGWMRKTRATTPADAVRLRFGPAMEQIFVYVGVASSMLWGGVFLLGLANFISAAFNLPVPVIILFAGIVVIFYSVSGGAWSVMITDSLQAFIMIPICIALAWLSLKAVGGMDGLMDGIREKGLSGDYALIVENNHVYRPSAGKIGAGLFTGAWVLAAMFNSIIMSVNMTGCYRYLAAKTCRDAHKAAFFAAGLLFLGAFIWFTPPMVGRILFEQDIEALAAEPVALADAEVQATADMAAAVGDDTAAEARTPAPKPQANAQLRNPGDGAYAMVAKKLLPKGLLGLIMVAMFAAAMSSLDSFLTGTAGLVGKNIYPPLARKVGLPALNDRQQLLFTKIINLCLGLWAMWLAYHLYRTSSQGGIYEITLQIILLVGTPLGLPYALAFFMRKLPSWAPMVGAGCGLLGSAAFKYGGLVGWTAPGELPWHIQLYISITITLVPTMLTSLFWSRSSIEHRQRVDEFFTLLKTPIDFEKEVGGSDDHSQLKIVGGLGLLIAVLILLLLFFVDAGDPQIAVVFVALFIGIISGIMWVAGLRAKKREHGRSVVD